MLIKMNFKLSYLIICQPLFKYSLKLKVQLVLVFGKKINTFYTGSCIRFTKKNILNGRHLVETR